MQKRLRSSRFSVKTLRWRHRNWWFTFSFSFFLTREMCVVFLQLQKISQTAQQQKFGAEAEIDHRFDVDFVFRKRHRWIDIKMFSLFWETFSKVLFLADFRCFLLSRLKAKTFLGEEKTFILITNYWQSMKQNNKTVIIVPGLSTFSVAAATEEIWWKSTSPVT